MALRLPSLTLLAGLIVATGLGGSAAYWVEAQRGHDRLLREVAAHNEQRARQLALSVGQTVGALIRLFDMALIELREAHGSDEASFAAVADLVRKGFPPKALNRILVVDATGRVVYSSDGAGIGVDMSDRTYVRAHTAPDAPDQLFVGPAVRGRIAERGWVIPFSRAIRRDGRLIGVVAASMEPAYLADMLGTVSLNPHDILSVTHADGSYLARNRGLDGVLGSAPPADRPFLQPESGTGGTYRAVSAIDAIPVSFAWTRLDPWPVIAVAGLDETAELAPIRDARDLDLRRDILVSGAFGTVMALICGLLIWAQRQQRQLAARETLLGSVMNSLRDSIVVLDGQGRVIRVNEGWRILARANGASPDLVEGIGVDYFEVCRRAGQHDSDSRAILAGMQAVLAGTQPRFDHEYACHTLTGMRWYAGRITRLDGQTPGLVVSHTDITERTLAAIRLAREAARYQAILRTASDGIHIFDSTGTVIEASESFWRLLGHDPAAPPALSIDTIDTALDGEDPAVAFERLYAVPRLVETRYRSTDGTLIDVEVDTHGAEVEGQRLVYASARDIRRRRRLETALTEHIARLHRQFENLRVLSEIAATRPEAEGGRVAQALAIGRRHLGLPAGFLVRVQGGHCAVVHRDTDPPDLGPEVGTLLPLDQTITAVTIATGDVVAIPDMANAPQTVPSVRSDWGIASYIGAPVPVAGGAFGALAFCGTAPYPRAFDEGDAEFTRLLARWIGSVIDEEMIRQTLAASNAELEQFAYVASHDLRQPLRQIASFVSLLERRYGERLDDEARSYITFAREGAVRMDTLIVDLLEFSRVGRDGREAAPIALGPVVERVVATLSRLIGETGASIEIAPDLPTVRGTVTDLTRLFQNLITNAITYRRPDAPPRVRITTRADGKSQVVTVSDNGIGIEPAYFETIFRIFQRLHTPDKYEGTGIGLAICKKVVEQMNGRIWVDSAIGQGASFHVAFPSQTP